MRVAAIQPKYDAFIDTFIRDIRPLCRRESPDQILDSVARAIERKRRAAKQKTQSNSNERSARNRN